MAIKVGINGFGRIGRVALRIMVERGSSSYQICGINLRNADLDYMVYQVKYDSVFRTFRDTVEHDDRHLIINGKKIRVYSESDASQIPWDDCGAEYIIESTGVFNTVERPAPICKTARKKVIISAPSKDDIMPTFVMGVNHLKYTPDMNVVSNASCTTNCLAPMTKVINDTFGIRQALMSTIHPPPPSRRPWTPVQAGTGGRAAASGQHYPLQHRCCQGCWSGDPGTERQNDRHELPCAHQRCVRGGPHRPAHPSRQLSRCVRGHAERSQEQHERHHHLHHGSGGLLRPDGLFRDLHL